MSDRLAPISTMKLRPRSLPLHQIAINYSLFRIVTIHFDHTTKSAMFKSFMEKFCLSEIDLAKRTSVFLISKDHGRVAKDPHGDVSTINDSVIRV